MGSQLFRQEAIDARRPNIFGDTLDVSDGGNRILYPALMLTFVLFFAFVIFAEYPKYIAVHGVIVPDQGLVKVQLARTGIIDVIHVSEGQIVKRGEVLFHIRQDKVLLSGDDVSLKRKQGLEKILQGNSEGTKRSKTDEDMERQKLLQDRNYLNEQIGAIQAKRSSLLQRHDIQEQQLTKLKELLVQGHVNKKEINDSQNTLLALKEQLKEVERDLSLVNQRLLDKNFDIQRLANKYDEVRKNLDRDFVQIEAEKDELDLSSTQAVLAPMDGQIVGLTTVKGQSVDSNRTLLSIVPSGSRLEIHLAVPSRSMGQIKPGNIVQYALDPFPASLYGYQQGTVKELSQSILAPNDLAENELLAIQEPSYRVIVRLEKETKKIRGEDIRLQPGTGVEAKIIAEDRHLYEWIFQPIIQILRGGA